MHMLHHLMQSLVHTSISLRH